MKKLTKNQKNALLIGGGALALLAVTQLSSGSPSKPKVKLISTDNNSQMVYLNINGKQYSFPYNLKKAHAIGEGYQVESGPFNNNAKTFILKQYGMPVSEVFRINV